MLSVNARYGQRYGLCIPKPLSHFVFSQDLNLHNIQKQYQRMFVDRINNNACEELDLDNRTQVVCLSAGDPWPK